MFSPPATGHSHDLNVEALATPTDCDEALRWLSQQLADIKRKLEYASPEARKGLRIALRGTQVIFERVAVIRKQLRAQNAATAPFRTIFEGLLRAHVGEDTYHHLRDQANAMAEELAAR